MNATPKLHFTSQPASRIIQFKFTETMAIRKGGNEMLANPADVAFVPRMVRFRRSHDGSLSSACNLSFLVVPGFKRIKI
jgi:hypothetical protein